MHFKKQNKKKHKTRDKHFEDDFALFSLRLKKW